MIALKDWHSTKQKYSLVMSVMWRDLRMKLNKMTADATHAELTYKAAQEVSRQQKIHTATKKLHSTNVQQKHLEL